MTSKPSYEELYQGYKKLEELVEKQKRQEEIINAWGQEKEDILNTLIEHVIHEDSNMMILWANEAACKSANQKHEELIGRYCYEVWPQRNSPCPDCPVKKAMKTKEPQEIEKTTPDGRSWIIRGYPKMDTKGQVVGGIEVTLEITEQKQSEKALKESKEIYHKLFNSINDAIFVHQPTKEGEPGKFIEVNDVACKRYGYTKKEFFELAPPDITVYGQNEDAHTSLKKILAEKYRNFESIHRTRNGDKFPVEVSAYLFSFHGKPSIFSIVHDITNRKKAEKEKSNLEEQLHHAQRMESIGTLAGGIAHDFNNILTPIIAYSEMAMIDLPLESPIQQNLRHIYKAGERAKNLVKQILTFARQREKERIPIKASQIVEEVIKFLRSTIPSTIDIQYKRNSKNDIVFGDPTQINQIVMNLCTNAAYAMREKGGILDIILDDEYFEVNATSRFAIKSPGHYLKLSVRDTGPGISPDILKKIFEPYFTTKSIGDGTGLGLAVVHGIVKDYGGDITVESEIERGSAFHVFLPIVETGVTLDLESKTEVPGGKEHILFVDDEKEIVDSIQIMLERLGYKVTARTSSIEALQAFRNSPYKYDLVITDMTMPNLTGSNLAKKLMDIRPDIPIILCTGFSSQIDERRAEQMGIRSFVMKPVVANEIANKIREAIDNN